MANTSFGSTCMLCGKTALYCTCSPNAYNAQKYHTVYTGGCPRCLDYPCHCGYMQNDVRSIDKLVEERVKERLKIADKPVLTDCFVGYRIWHYNAGYLQSAFKTEYNWPHRKALTKDVYNNTGIHAVKEYKGVIPLLSAYCWEGTNWIGEPKKATRGIAGSIYMWGEVVEHTAGYLAEFAYPKELFVDESCDILTIMQLEENYGVPVSIREELNPPDPNQKISGHGLPASIGSSITFFTYSPLGALSVP